MSTEAILTVDRPVAPAERFEQVLASLQQLVDSSGCPLDAIRNHPAVRPLLKEMRLLLVAVEDPAALIGDARYPLRPSAQVIDLAAARAARRR